MTSNDNYTPLNKMTDTELWLAIFQLAKIQTLLSARLSRITAEVERRSVAKPERPN